MEVVGKPQVQNKLLKKLTKQIGKGDGKSLVALRDFLVIDRNLVEILSKDFESNARNSMVVEMKLHQFIQPVGELRQVALNVVEILKTSFNLNNPTWYIEIGPNGCDPTLLYPEPSAPQGVTKLITEGQPPFMMGIGVPMAPGFDPAVNPYAMPPPGPNPYAMYGPAGVVPIPQAPVQPVPVVPNVPNVPAVPNIPPQMAGASGVPPLPMPGDGKRYLVYLDHNPDNNRKLVKFLEDNGTIVFVFTSSAQFALFVQNNYPAVIAHVTQFSSLRIMCDRQFSTDFQGDNTGITIVDALNGMGLINAKILVYCWRIELVSHLAKLGVIVTKDIKIARDFGRYIIG